MRPFALSLPPRLGLSWLVWVALLLPVSQSFAAWHEFSHWQQSDVARSDDAGPLHQSACELCLAAAAVAHGGFPTAVAVVPRPELAAQPTPQPRIESADCAPVTRYLSRAPPASLR